MTVTIRDIVDRLGVSLGAIRLWRDGSSEREPLVFESEIVGAGTRVWIEEADLLAYLDTYRPDLAEKWRTG